eukprot:TRINITY_DN3664_c0_g1_i1.p1 TRINITY_DN3664_c0_g1~~TRINITY_DN3664_c0_g1_i1.p1  ORF type:complete len:102 (+),score=0.77 TRINITY_DN3664_c0_g1_i1:50-355(+)
MRKKEVHLVYWVVVRTACNVLIDTANDVVYVPFQNADVLVQTVDGVEVLSVDNLARTVDALVQTANKDPLEMVSDGQHDCVTLRGSKMVLAFETALPQTSF